MSCMTCLLCGAGHNEDVCPECGSTINGIDEIEYEETYEDTEDE